MKGLNTMRLVGELDVARFAFVVSMGTHMAVVGQHVDCNRAQALLFSPSFLKDYSYFVLLDFVGGSTDQRAH